MSGEKKWSEIVREERDKGNVVYLCIDSVMVAPIKEIVKQPADGLLWDLNRDCVTALSFMDEEGMTHWVNNFAVALVIRELKSQVTQLEEYRDSLILDNRELQAEIDRKRVTYEGNVKIELPPARC